MHTLLLAYVWTCSTCMDLLLCFWSASYGSDLHFWSRAFISCSRAFGSRACFVCVLRLQLSVQKFCQSFQFWRQSVQSGWDAWSCIVIHDHIWPEIIIYNLCIVSWTYHPTYHHRRLACARSVARVCVYMPKGPSGDIHRPTSVEKTDSIANAEVEKSDAVADGSHIAAAGQLSDPVFLYCLICVSAFAVFGPEPSL